ncbi:MAG TPA: CmcJ/NvfI family oxidoreductase [Candidatus Binataceae bacterium]|nr:CmcJ/NvfI family oxidoreductase [Candidatus Binataceae bacterium]
MAVKSNLFEAVLNYAGNDGGFCRRTLPIYDARAVAQLALDREGFVLEHRATAVRNFYDPDEVRAVYYPGVEQLLREVMGAAMACAFEHDVRRAEPAAASGQAAREPVRVVHDDYTEKSAPERVRLYLPDKVDGLLKRRFAVVNVWRPLRGPVRDTPLAVCDAQTLAPQDLVPTSEGVKHEVYLFKFRPAHRWFYFPEMQPDEAILLKCFDSIRDGRARFTAHTAIDLPLTQPPPPPRESIEVRALVFF